MGGLRMRMIDSRRTTSGVLAAALAAICASTAVIAQDKDTLWTKASAEGKVILLEWDKHHPWDATLAMQGVTLIAKYRVDARREVTEAIAKGTMVPGEDRTMRFRLPDNVQSNPAGPVCLIFQLTDRRLLPIRRSNEKGDDTVGFRYQPWEQQVREQAQARSAQGAVAAAQQALKTSEQSIANQEGSVARRGWSTDVASCDKISAPTATAAAARPFDVVSPEEQDDAARRICVRRVWKANDVVTNYYIEKALPDMLKGPHDVEAAQKNMARAALPFIGIGGADIPQVMQVVLNALGKDNATVVARQDQIQAFMRDWNKWAAGAKAYKPQLGTEDDYLGWPSTAGEVGFRIFGRILAKALNAEWAVQNLPQATAQDFESYLGASLDAYNGCVSDGKKQLKIKYDNWQTEQANAPKFSASERDFLVRECKQEIGLLDKLKAEHATLQTQLTQAQQALTAATSPAALPSKAQQLNSATCSQ